MLLRQFVSLIISNVRSFQWNRPEVQAESCSLNPWQTCHYHTRRHVLPGISVQQQACRIYSRAGMLVIILPWQSSLLVQIRGKEANTLHLSLSLMFPCPANKACGVFSNSFLPSRFGMQPTTVAMLYGLCSLGGFLQTTCKAVARLQHCTLFSSTLWLLGANFHPCMVPFQLSF